VLALGGVAVVSVTHPHFELHYYASSAYFDIDAVRAAWRGFGRFVEVPSYRRALGETLGPITDVVVGAPNLMHATRTRSLGRASFVCTQQVSKEGSR